MRNRIRATNVEIRRLSAAEAEVWVIAELEVVNTGTELRVRLVGPHCPGVSTVQVAYPLRPPPRAAESPGSLAVRALIPEPNLWTEETPFFYEGPLELWQDGQRC